MNLLRAASTVTPVRRGMRSRTNLVAIKAMIALAIAAWPGASSAAEVLRWTWGQEIDVPVEVSSSEISRARTVVLPGSEVTYVHQVWEDAAANIQAYKNGVLVVVYAPTFDHKVVVFDKGTFYTLHVHVVADKIDNVLKIEDATKRDEAKDAASPAAVGSVDNEAMQLMQHMLGGAQSVTVTDAPDITIVNGKRQKYRLLFEDDAMRIISLRIYRSTSLIGYQCVLTWKAQGSHRINLQNLMIDGAICVSSTKQDILDPRDPSVPINAKEPLVFWYVCEPKR